MKALFRNRNRATDITEIQANGDGVVNVSTQSLIALHHGATSLSLKPQKIRALQSGGYISPFKGRGMEFDEVRPYMAGDDVRTLDWRVTARTGRAHTKLFREERERSVLLWMDLRNPMFFATQGAYKAVRMAETAALLGWAAIQHGDRLGGLLFGDSHHLELRPRRGKASLLHLFNKVATDTSWQAESHRMASNTSMQLQQSLVRLRRVAQPGSLLFLISDFNGLDQNCTEHLSYLARHCDLVLIAIHDPIEQELPPAGQYRFSDGQRFMSLNTAASSLRQDFRTRFELQQQHLLALCRRQRIYPIIMSTADKPLTILRQGLGGM